jgi:hypothetical protein
MKLFQKLLLAPAALGLMAPVAASASELASAGGMNSYIQQNDLHNFRVWADQNQVTNVQQFNDVKPTDWAYQALSNLIERYGCVAGYPNGTFKGGQAMTRYEAAALLNACLDRITETTDEIQRLQQDFAKELSILQGRVGSLEKKVGTLESTQFSTTTKLEGDTYWTIGASSFGSSSGGARTGSNNPANLNENYGALTFNYDLRLNLKTSFTGKDLLYTRLRAGNYLGSSFGGNPYSLGALDRAFPGSNNSGFANSNNTFYLDRLYYRFPVGKVFTAAIGPAARNTEFLGTAPFYYTDHAGLDFFQLHGAPGTYNKATGSTFAFIWKQPSKKGKPYFTASTSLVSPAGYSADAQGTFNVATANGQALTNSGGILGNRSADSWLTQIAYVKDNWKAAFAWRFGQCGELQNYQNRRGTQAATQNLLCNTTAGGQQPVSNNFALSWAWQPKKGGTIVPALSLGYGYSAYSQPGTATNATTVSSSGSAQTFGALGLAYPSQTTFNGGGNIAATQSWTVALQWKDAFTKGNSAGMAVGQPSFVTALRNGQTPQDGNYAWEWWYRFKVSDQISLTPTLFYLSNPSSAGVNSAAVTSAGGGGQTNAAGGTTGTNVFGAFVAAQFKF